MKRVNNLLDRVRHLEHVLRLEVLKAGAPITKTLLEHEKRLQRLEQGALMNITYHDGKKLKTVKWQHRGWGHPLGPSGEKLSRCCANPVKVSGKTTKHYRCAGCGEACDLKVCRGK